MSTRLRHTPDRMAIRKLGIALLVVALVASAGCAGAILGGGSSGGELVDYVPQDQNVVVEVDMSVTQDDTTQQFLQAGEEEDPESQQDLEQSLSRIEAQTGLDPRGLNTVLFYAQTGMTTSVQDATSQESGAILLDTEWTTEDVEQAFESNESIALEERSYGESGVFYEVVPRMDTAEQRLFIGVHGDGVFVVGSEAEVRNSLDITYAGGNALDGSLADAYSNARDGYVTFAMTVPESNATSGSSMVGMAALTESVEAVTGVYYTDGDAVGMEGRIATTSTETAGLLNAGIQSELAPIKQDPQYSEVASNLEVTTDGSDLVVTVESDVQTLIEASESDN